MKTALALPTLAALAMAVAVSAAEKPRVFITDSQSVQYSGNAAVGEAKGSLLLNSNTSPQNIEVIKSFLHHCPVVLVTANREKAEYLVRLDHDDSSLLGPLVRGSKVAVFNKDEDLIYSNSTRKLSNAVKGACVAITGKAAQPTR